jgi:hypothetical protein
LSRYRSLNSDQVMSYTNNGQTRYYSDEFSGDITFFERVSDKKYIQIGNVEVGFYNYVWTNVFGNKKGEMSNNWCDVADFCVNKEYEEQRELAYLMYRLENLDVKS